jgi:NADPH-dependent curcumin reductase CurA
MERARNRQWRLARRPEGLATVDDFEWMESTIPSPRPGQILVRTKLLSLDPTNRSWMSDRETYLPRLNLGEVMRGIGVGTVVESNDPAFRVGASLYGLFGWQDYAIVEPGDRVLVLPENPEVPLTMHLSLFGHIGITAYFGLAEVARPKAGETLVVSAAAGAVGSLAGQLGKLWGCRVVGIAGTHDKCAWLTNELGFDAAINYKDETSLVDALAHNCPSGVDVYFDNVGGAILDAVLNVINLNARIALCGMIAGYNDPGRAGHGANGPQNLFQVIVKRARMEGFLALDYWDRAPEAIAALAAFYQSGHLKYRTHIIDGLENAPAAMNMLFDGSNQGKLMIRI